MTDELGTMHTFLLNTNLNLYLLISRFFSITFFSGLLLCMYASKKKKINEESGIACNF